MLNLVIFAVGCSPNIEQMKTQEDDIIEIELPLSIKPHIRGVFCL